MTPTEFQAATRVSDDVLGRLRAYVELLLAWQSRLNLISAASEADIWRRHVYDSAQLHPLLPAGARKVLDLGSGAGFPGLVLALMGTPGVHLAESDSRKCRFLETVSRETSASVTILGERVEALPPQMADVITARACAPLPRLLSWARPHLGKGGICLFMKGKKAEEELTDAAKAWTMTVGRIPSLSGGSGVILKIEAIARKEARARKGNRSRHDR